MSFVVQRAIVAMLQSLLFLLQERATPQGKMALWTFKRENRKAAGMAQDFGGNAQDILKY